VGHRFRKGKRGGGTMLHSRSVEVAEGHQGSDGVGRGSWRSAIAEGRRQAGWVVGGPK
jgi:hypothetical protein